MRGRGGRRPAGACSRKDVCRLGHIVRQDAFALSLKGKMRMARRVPEVRFVAERGVCGQDVLYVIQDF